MNRCFLSKKYECPGECKYCFGKWDSYKKFPHTDIFEDELVIYPNCDGDIFDEYFDEAIEYLKSLPNKYISISISTKFNITDTQLKKLKDLHDHIYFHNNGLLKFSVSFSCEKSLPLYEGNTATYKERISLIRRIYEYNIPSIVLIKPILPFVDITEYYKIVDDTIGYCPYYVLGDLYISKDTTFYKDYIEGKYYIGLREVSWNGSNGIWNVVEDINKKNSINTYILSKGGTPFNSDLDGVIYLREQKFNGGKV